MNEIKITYGLVNGKSMSEYDREKARKKLKKWSASQSQERLIRVLGSRLKYQEHGDELCQILKTDLPQSYQGLITLLSGNPYNVSQDGKYLLGLLSSTEVGQDLGKEIATKRELIQESREILTGDIIRKIYRELPEDLRKRFFKNEHVYHDQIDEIRKYFGEGMGSTFDRLIPLLGGDKDRGRGAKYVQALMESPEKGEEFLVGFLEKRELNKEKRAEEERRQLEQKKSKKRKNSIYLFV